MNVQLRECFFGASQDALLQRGCLTGLHAEASSSKPPSHNVSHCVQDGEAHEEGFFGCLFQETEPGSPAPAGSAGADSQQAWEAVLSASLCEAQAVLHQAFHEAPVAEVKDSPCLNAIIYVLDLGISSSSLISIIGRQLAGLREKVFAGDGFSYVVKALLAPASFAQTAQVLHKANRMRHVACKILLQQIQLGEACSPDLIVKSSFDLF